MPGPSPQPLLPSDRDPDLALFGFEEGDRWLDRLRESELPPPLGSIGSYEVISELGRGGQGVVYRARQPGMFRDIALKRLAPGALASPRARRQFEREIEAAAALNHPNIVAAYATDVVDGVPVLAMELVQGQPFNRWAGGRSRAEILTAFVGVCDAVQHAHGRGVIHRDLKPSNILIVPGEKPGSGPSAKVLDFGLARLSTDAEPSISGSFQGTPAYASPEQAAGRPGDVDARSDVYSLGVVLFEALAGRLPEEPAGSGEEPLPAPLAAVLAKALSIDPASRYATVGALADDLRRFIAGQPVLARPATAIEVLRSLARRHRVATALTGVAVVAILALTVALGVTVVRLERERSAVVRARDQERSAKLTAQHINEAIQSLILSADPDTGGSSEVKVREVLDRAAANVDTALASEPAAAAGLHRALGIAYYGVGRYKDSVEQFRRALAYFREKPGEENADLIGSLRHLGRVLPEVHENQVDVHGMDEADALCSEAVELARAMKGGDGSALAGALVDLGHVRFMSGDFAGAATINAEALRVCEQHGNGDSIRAANALDGLGKSLMRMGNADGALEALNGALELNIRHFGENHTNCCIALFHIGQAYALKGDYGAAEQTWRRALDIERRIYAGPHPLIDKTLRVLRSMLWETGRGNEAKMLSARRPAPTGAPPAQTPMAPRP